ncbi:uncharacterized protein LOC126899931 isoform X2 [Daktulosphaira vitifoliae]|uniref:uncharacterized protein LOC126899931 isoform X2 n=1 Tax=Daktulosphaira vitifoliae TaxID=58002 RepID=UPI0021AA17D7|nr:uncharacterized protein LOC126899931 isoform X2 [Daktulosphaira vitifoliae]
MNLYYLITILTLNFILPEVLTRSCFRNKSKSDCIICLMELTSKFSTHKCGCKYHNNCINKWKTQKYNATCPNCQEILPREQETPIEDCTGCLRNNGCKRISENCSHFYCKDCFQAISIGINSCPFCFKESNGER